MTLIELLDLLSAGRVQIWADGDRLRVRAPIGAVTPEVRAALEAHKAELLAHLGATTEGARLSPIARAPRSGRLPLSFAQQRLWFLAELEPDSAAYNIPAALAITGPLDPAIVARAAAEIVRRHEVLRTTFRNENGEPVVDIHDRMPIDVPVVDLTALPPASRDAEVRRLASAQTRALFDLTRGPLLRVSLVALAPAARDAEVRRLASAQTRALFDLTRGPLLRVSLVALSKHEHVLLFTIHHLASDGWSSRVFMRELAALYDAFARGEASPLPELPIQYADFAAWQREWLRGDVLERQLAYWRARLDHLPVLELPPDRPRPPVQTFDGASARFVLPRDLGERLKTLARQEGVTLFQLLLAGFAALLHHVTGADDLPIGSPVVNRNRRELEDLIGFFVNTVILRVDLTGRPTVRELLRRVREVTLEAYAHQDLPFEQLVAELQPERDLSRHALFQTVFVLQDNPVERQELPGLTLRQLDIESWHVKFDLVVNVWDSQEGLVVWWEYNSGLFDRDSIGGLFDRYARLLAAIAAAPSATVDDLDILTADERALADADLAVPALTRDFSFEAAAGAAAGGPA